MFYLYVPDYNAYIASSGGNGKEFYIGASIRYAHTFSSRHAAQQIASTLEWITEIVEK